MNKKKEYLITIFIKKATAYYTISASLEKSFQLLTVNYPNVTYDEVAKLKKKYTIDRYIQKITPIIDKHFSEEDMNTIINFYTTLPGSKLFDQILSKEIAEAGENTYKEMEKDFNDKSQSHT